MTLTKFFRKIGSLIPVILILTFTGCNINAPGTAEYVSAVKEDMLQAVNLTRQLKEQQKTLDARSIDDAKKTLDILESLDKVYSDLILSESPDSYDYLDEDIKKNAKNAITQVQALKSLITAAVNTGDDTLYKQDCRHITEQYEESYNELVDISSQITTKYRNE